MFVASESREEFVQRHVWEVLSKIFGHDKTGKIYLSISHDEWQGFYNDPNLQYYGQFRNALKPIIDRYEASLQPLVPTQFKWNTTPYPRSNTGYGQRRFNFQPSSQSPEMLLKMEFQELEKILHVWYPSVPMWKLIDFLRDDPKITLATVSRMKQSFRDFENLSYPYAKKISLERRSDFNDVVFGQMNQLDLKPTQRQLDHWKQKQVQDMFEPGMIFSGNLLQRLVNRMLEFDELEKKLSEWYPSSVPMEQFLQYLRINKQINATNMIRSQLDFERLSQPFVQSFMNERRSDFNNIIYQRINLKPELTDEDKEWFLLTSNQVEKDFKPDIFFDVNRLYVFVDSKLDEIKRPSATTSIPLDKNHIFAPSLKVKTAVKSTTSSPSASTTSFASVTPKDCKSLFREKISEIFKDESLSAYMIDNKCISNEICAQNKKLSDDSLKSQLTPYVRQFHQQKIEEIDGKSFDGYDNDPTVYGVIFGMFKQKRLYDDAKTTCVVDFIKRTGVVELIYDPEWFFDQEKLNEAIRPIVQKYPKY